MNPTKIHVELEISRPSMGYMYVKFDIYSEVYICSWRKARKGEIGACRN